MVELGKLEIYILSIKFSDTAWRIYEKLPNPFRYNMGDQLIRSADSIGANIAEGYGRYHYKDSVKFYYNARGSLWESKHWIYLLHKRDLIAKEQYNTSMQLLEQLGKKLNNFIQSIKRRGDKT